jgi:hypothetical protein
MKNRKNFDAFVNENENGPDDHRLEDDFTNMGYDDDNVLIGNCKHCGGNGVDVMAHKEECEKIPGNNKKVGNEPA